MQRSEYTILTELEADYFDETFKVSTKNGFAVAAAVVNFKDDVFEDPEIGSVEFYILFFECGTCPFQFR